MLAKKEFMLIFRSMLSHSKICLKIQLLTNIEVILYTRTLEFLQNFLLEEDRSRLVFNGTTVNRRCQFYKSLHEVNIKALKLFKWHN